MHVCTCTKQEPEKLSFFFISMFVFYYKLDYTKDEGSKSKF